jgi:hypothetical protein
MWLMNKDSEGIVIVRPEEGSDIDFMLRNLEFGIRFLKWFSIGDWSGSVKVVSRM